MLPLSLLLQHSLLYGGILSLIMSVVIFGSLYLRPQIWVDDAPAAVRAALGPMSSRDRQLKRWLGIPTLLAVVGLLLHAILRLVTLSNGHPTFVDVALTTFLIIQVFNLVDLLLIDWLVVETIQPGFILIPGAEHLRGMRDYGFHFRAFLKGLLGSLIASVIIGGLTSGIIRIVS